MSWGKFDDQYPLNRKMLDAGLDALGFDVCGVLYCNRYLTDGFIPDDELAVVFPKAKNPKKLADRLVEAGRWKRERTGYRIHDFLEYNPSRAEVEETRRKRAEAGRVGGSKSKPKAKANGQAPPEQPDKQLASESAGQNPNPVSRIPVGDVKKSQNRGELTPDVVAARLNLVCKNPSTEEAWDVVNKLSTHVDLALIDECVGYAMKLDMNHQPTSPRYFLTAVADWADKRGVVVPELSL